MKSLALSLYKKIVAKISEESQYVNSTIKMLAKCGILKTTYFKA